MKKFAFTLLITIGFLCCKAQEQLAFPFQGGTSAMTQFFKDSVTLSPEIIQKRAYGIAIFKFTADEKGTIKKIVIYYADDSILVNPIVEALRKSDRKWIIPEHEKSHDFIISFSIGFNPPAVAGAVLQRAAYTFYHHKKPIIASNQVPLDMATLLPTLTINYDVPVKPVIKPATP